AKILNISLVVLHCSTNKSYKQRMRISDSRFQLGMELRSYEERMFLQLYNLNKVPLLIDPRGYHSGIFELFLVLIIKFIAVAVTLRNFRLPVNARRFGALFKGTLECS